MRNMILSASSITALQSCARKFQYEKIDNIVPVGTAPALEKGSLIHYLLEQYYRVKQKEIIAGSFAEARIGFIAQDVINLGRQYADSQELSIAETEEIINFFRLYLVKYRSETWIPLSIEQPFSIVLFEDEKLDLRVLLQGKIDLTVKSKEGILIVDHKSSGRNSKKTKLSNQFFSYCYAFDVKMAVRNNIVFIKDESKQFSREIISYTQSNIDEWYENTVQWIIETDARIRSNNFPMNLSSCNFCPYESLCTVDRENRDWRKSRDFKTAEPHDIFKEKEEIS